MNREIRFRAWDNNIKKMHNDVSPWRWDFCISNSWHRWEKSTGSGLLGSGGDTAEMLVPAVRFTDIMQYTGLKDTDAKSIIESDIVSIGEDICTIKYSEMASQWWIVYKNGKFKELTPDYGDGTGNKCVYLKVIGNIHENPELL